MSDIKYTPDMAGSGQYGVCEKCSLPPTKEGHDGCIGLLPSPDVMNACCGHGKDSSAYVQFWSDKDSAIRGSEAVNYIEKNKVKLTMSECGKCGFKWPADIHGEHSCTSYIKTYNDTLTAQNLALKAALETLIGRTQKVGGFPCGYLDDAYKALEVGNE